MRQPCPVCEAPSRAYASQTDPTSYGPVVTMRFICEQSHEWRIRVAKDLYELRRKRRYVEHAEYIRAKPTLPQVKAKVVKAVQSRIKGDADDVAAVTAKRKWWE